MRGKDATEPAPPRPAGSPDPNVTHTRFSGVSCWTLTSCVGAGFSGTSLVAGKPLEERFG
jgi:hypothetical protein